MVHDLVEKGKQIGISYSFLKEEGPFWVTLALQKIGIEYIAHIALISESNMDQEKFEIYEAIAFPGLEKAIDHLQKRNPQPLSRDGLSTFEGQKVFNPQAEEIHRDKS